MLKGICPAYGITDEEVLGELAYDSYYEKQPQASVIPWRDLPPEERERWNLVGETLTVNALLTADRRVAKSVAALKETLAERFSWPRIPAHNAPGAQNQPLQQSVDV